MGAVREMISIALPPFEIYDSCRLGKHPMRRLKTTHALISQGGKGQTIAASTSSNGMAVTTK